MKCSKTLLAVSAGLILTATLPAAAQHDHHGHEAAKAELHLDADGKKWPTDEPLRRNMGALRSELAGRLHAIHEGKLTNQQYAALGDGIEKRVGNIVAQCKLDPRADAVLHVIVADLVGAADVMQGKAEGVRSVAAHQAISAVNDYGRYFDHPRWKPIE